MLLGQCISAFSFGSLINMPMVGYESCINDPDRLRLIWGVVGGVLVPKSRLKTLISRDAEFRETSYPEIQKSENIFPDHVRINSQIRSLKTPDPDAPKNDLSSSDLYLTFIFAKSLFSLSTINLYAPFMGIMFSRLCIRAFVRSVVRPSVPLQVKSFGRGSFRWSWACFTYLCKWYDPLNSKHFKENSRQNQGLSILT